MDTKVEVDNLISPEGSLRSDKLNPAISKSQNYLLSLQREEGYWMGELECDVCITADYIMLQYILGTVDHQKIKKAANWLLKNQKFDGGWPIYFDGPSDLNVSVKAYFALKLAGFSEQEPFMVKARKRILWMGGVMNANVFTKIYLAFFGQYDWKGIPAMPVEMIFFPRFFYFNVYQVSYWARTIIVPLLIVVAKKPLFKIPDEANIEELYLEPKDTRDYSYSKPQDKISIANLFIRNVYTRIDTLLKILERYHIRPLRKAAIMRAESWILERFEMSGGLGAIWPAMFNSIVALKCLGYENTSSQMQGEIKNLDALGIEDENFLKIQPCLSPVWDTGLTIISLLSSGISRDNPALIKAGKWLLSKQTRHFGDWQKKLRKRVKPGGWYFEFENEFYPDVDDTAIVLMALNSIGFHEVSLIQRSIQRGINWVFGMQNPDGGWGAFDYTDSNKEILNQLPFAAPFFGAFLDPSTSDVAGRCLGAMGCLGYKKTEPVAKKAIEFLKKEQEKEGCWYGRWGINYIYGTWSVLLGLASIGEDMQSEYIKRAVDWLKEHQNPDGGWGESCITYENKASKGFGKSTASQTAWAIMGLISAGESKSPEVLKGINFLIETQQDDGSWKESEFTGTGFPMVFYLKYHMYKNYFPLMALGRYRKFLSQ